jgi:hypothetical protein
MTDKSLGTKLLAEADAVLREANGYAAKATAAVERNISP